MNIKYKVMMAATLMVAGSMLSTNLLAGQGDGKGSKVAGKEKMEQHRGEVREKMKAEWERICALPAQEQAVAKREFQKKIQRMKAAREKHMQNRKEQGQKRVQDGERKEPSEEQKNAHKAKMKKHRAEIKAEWKRICALPEEEQAAAKREFQKKREQMRAKHQKDMQNRRSEAKGKQYQAKGQKDRPVVAAKAEGEGNKKPAIKAKGEGKNKPEAKKDGGRQGTKAGARPSIEEQQKKISEIEAKIDQLPLQKQEEARARLEKKKQALRKRAAQQKANNVSVEEVNKLIDSL
jgi:hypothetical protein